MHFIQIIAGFILLFAGGEMLVRGSVSLACRFNIPKIIIGGTIIALGTSAPEIFISISAALKGNYEIAIGNVVGSNIANILLVVGITTLIFPITFKRSLPTNLKFILLLFITTLFLFFSFLNFSINWIKGLILLTTYFIFLIYMIKHHISPTDNEEIELNKDNPLIALSLVIIASFALIFGSDLLVNGASSVAKIFGVSESVIALTIVAIGGSSPEIVTCVASAIKRQTSLIIGNILGSNTINICFAIAIPSLVTTIPITKNIAEIDIIIMTLITAIFTIFALKFGKFYRTSAILMLAAYICYVIFLYQRI